MMLLVSDKGLDRGVLDAICPLLSKCLGESWNHEVKTELVVDVAADRPYWQVQWIAAAISSFGTPDFRDWFRSKSGSCQSKMKPLVVLVYP